MNTKKYVRIQVRYTGATGKPVGIFGACHHVIYNKYQNYNTSENDRKTFEEVESWFENNLPNPPFYHDGNPRKVIIL